jgi:hypothetical protein
MKALHSRAYPVTWPRVVLSRSVPILGGRAAIAVADDLALNHGLFVAPLGPIRSMAIAILLICSIS